jgi:hypothetical protein
MTRMMVGLNGFEPLPPCLQSSCHTVSGSVFVSNDEIWHGYIVNQCRLMLVSLVVQQFVSLRLLAFRTLICSGVVPQQPPIIVAPHATHS